MSRLRPVALGAVLVALALAVFTGLQAYRTAATADARAEALEAARTRVPVLLSYDKATLEDDLDRALDQTTSLGWVVAESARVM